MMSSELSSSEIEGLLSRGISGNGAGYVSIRDPHGAEQLAVELARRCQAQRPTCLLIWERPHDLILAHCVAREMGVTAVRAYDSDGLVGFEGDFPAAGGRVLLLADTFSSAESVRAMRAVAEQQGQEVVAAAALRDLGGPGHEELDLLQVPLIALVRQTSNEAEARDG
jgi:hypothetical protein